MKSKLDYKLLFSLLAVAIVWGTTYLGIRIAITTIPPWFVTSIRQGIACLLLFVFLIYKQELTWIGWDNFKRQLIPSILMIVIANGFTTVAEQTIPSGLASLLASLSPLIIFIGSVLLGLQKPNLKGFIGVFIGFLGIVFIFREGLSNLLDPNYKIGILFMGMAIVGWASGTIYSKKNAHRSTNITVDLFYQFLISTVIQILIAFYFSDTINPHLWSIKSLLATVYLAIFGSIIAFFCYHYALQRVSATQVAILSYFNTIIAIFLGWLLLNEIITFDFIVATLLIIIGVFITNYKKKDNIPIK